MILKKGNVSLRYPEVKDAKRFFEIIKNPNFIHFRTPVSSVKAEKEWIRRSIKKRKNKFAYDFSIIYDGELVGGCGIKMDTHRKVIGELGYFVDEKYWGKGIATAAVKLLEKFCFEKLKLKRIEIVMKPENRASEKVAIKAGYKKEGLMGKAIEVEGKYYDAYLYAKVK